MTLFLIIYISGIVAGYIRWRNGERRRFNDWSIEDRIVVGIMAITMSWFLYLGAILLYPLRKSKYLSKPAKW